MAIIHSFPHGHRVAPPLGIRMTAVLSEMARDLIARYEQASTRRALLALDDGLLRDLGFSRGELKFGTGQSVVRE
jgi:uncharacterized protein YjiS (DUF1127 family)